MAKKQEQHSIEVGRTDKGHVVIAKNQEPVVIMPPRVALQLAAQVVKHASIIVSGAQMIDDAILQLESKLPPEGNGNEKITPMPSRLGPIEGEDPGQGPKLEIKEENTPKSEPPPPPLPGE